MEDKEMITKLKSCKTVEEIKTSGKEIGYELTDEEAKAFLEKFSKNDELSDDELSNVTGGCTWWRKGRAYSGIYPHYLIVTVANTCPSYSRDRSKDPADRDLWEGKCGYCRHATNYVPTYCHKRTYYNDPYNP